MHRLMQLKKTGLLLAAAFLLTVGCTAQTAGSAKPSAASVTKWEILTYGLPDLHREKAHKAVADRWGISFRSVGGCKVSEEIVATAKANNDKVYPLIEAKYGKDWITTFNQEVDKEYKRQRNKSIATR